MSKLLSHHHLAKLRRSSSSFRTAESISDRGNDRNTFESSTYDSRQHVWGANGRSFKYMQNNSGESIAPWGIILHV